MRFERWLAGGLLALTGCAAPLGASALRLEPYPVQVAGGLDRETTTPTTEGPASLPASEPASPGPIAPAIAAGSRLELLRPDRRLALSPGRFAVRVHVPPSRTVMVGVSGPARALKLFEVLGRGPLARLKTDPGDGELPAFVTFTTSSEPEPLLVVLDADAPVTLHRLDAPLLAEVAPQGARRSTPARPLPLVGMPMPTSSKAGYRFGQAPRYAFLRADAVEALRLAFRQVRRRFDREPIAIGDATQWNGDRPASDRLLARHVSHHEGRDVDLGLPGRDGDSSIRHRCVLELSPPDRATCKPGSVNQLDVERLAYLLAQLVEGPTPKGRYVADRRKRPGPVAPVERILADAAYVEAIREVLPELRKRRWIHDEAVEVLGDDAVLRASPWHTDHVHVRFAGEPAVVSDGLRGINVLP
jgi:hypothetical protein